MMLSSNKTCPKRRKRMEMLSEVEGDEGAGESAEGRENSAAAAEDDNAAVKPEEVVAECS
eukprot:409080-Hanusia_phi.AAC.2